MSDLRMPCSRPSWAALTRETKRSQVGALHLHAGVRAMGHSVIVVHARAPNLRRIGFKRVDVCHPPRKMWPEMPTRRSARLCCGDSAVQPELGVSHQPVALLRLGWNTHIDVLMPLGNREWNPRIQFLLR